MLLLLVACGDPSGDPPGAVDLQADAVATISASASGGRLRHERGVPGGRYADLPSSSAGMAALFSAGGL